MKEDKLTLSVLQGKLAVCRLEKFSPIPDWVVEEDFFSITKTDDELSIVCYEECVPKNIKSEKGWRAFKVEGPLDFTQTGILASLANPLAEAGISIFAMSTFDTDYLLVKEHDLDESVKILKEFCNINK